MFLPYFRFFFSSPVEVLPVKLLQRLLAFFPVDLKITNQIEKVEPQNCFFSIKNEMILFVISEKVSRAPDSLYLKVRTDGCKGRGCIARRWSQNRPVFYKISRTAFNSFMSSSNETTTFSGEE